MAILEGWQVQVRFDLRAAALALVGAALIGGLLWPAPPEPGHTVYVHVTPRQARQGLPALKPSIVTRLVYVDRPAAEVATTDPHVDDVRVRLFCAPLTAPAVDTAGRVAPAAPRSLLLTAGTLRGKSLTQFGLYGDGGLYRGTWTLAHGHGGLEWRADGDSVVVRERRSLPWTAIVGVLGVAVGVGIGRGL